MPDQQSDDQQQLAVVARGISMTGPWGPVFPPLDLEVDAGGVTALIGPAGQGRTALLMILAGRMRPSSGTVSVFGRSTVRAVFGACALAGVEQLDSVFESVTVRDLVTEQTRWDAPWHRLVRRAGEAERDAICRPVFGDLPPPGLDEYVEQLSELDGLLLRIALANTARPPLLVVGGIDQLASDAYRETLVRRLVALGEHQTVITASVNEIPAGLGVHAQIPVPHLDHAELADHAPVQKGDD